MYKREENEGKKQIKYSELRYELRPTCLGVDVISSPLPLFLSGSNDRAAEMERKTDFFLLQFSDIPYLWSLRLISFYQVEQHKFIEELLRVFLTQTCTAQR